jgi:hypothetical protein
MVYLRIVFQQIRPSLHRIRFRPLNIRLRSLVDGISPQRRRYASNGITLISRRDWGATHLLMNPLVMHLAKRACKLRIMIAVCDVMLLNAKHTRRLGQSQLLPFAPFSFAPRRSDWLPVPQAAPPLNTRYSENSERAGSMATIVRPAVTSSTPAIFFPYQAASALRLPRK